MDTRDRSERNERKFLERLNLQRYVQMAQLVILAGAVALIVLNFSVITTFVGRVFSVITPLLIGIFLAYIINIPMVQIEKRYFPGNKSSWVLKSRRIVSLILSLIIILGIIIGVIILVIPQLSNATGLIIDRFPDIYQNMVEGVGKRIQQQPFLASWWGNMNQNANEVIKRIMDNSGNLVGGVFSVTMTALGSIFNIIFGLMFAIYMLLSKEKLILQFQNVAKAYFSAVRRERFARVLQVANSTFSGYITGQMTEAVVIGIIAIIAMFILRFPFALMIGSITGLTTFVPILGAYLGGIIGYLIILTVDPVKAMFFILFIVVLQQIDGNFIYPRIVGDSVGMPALWVLTAVLLGGGLFGVVGALLAVPTFATLFKLLKIDVHSKISEKENIRSGLVALKLKKDLSEDEKKKEEITEEQLMVEQEREEQEREKEKEKEK